MATKIRASNLHTDVKTMVTTMVGENALDSAQANLLIDAKFTANSTDNLSEGSSNLYFTNARADARADTRAQLKIDALVDAAPGSLDTLNELAAALGDDANFSTTITNSVATKLPLAGGTMTGHILFNNGIELRSNDTGGNVKTITRVNSSNELEYGWSSNGPVKFMGGGSYTERMRIHTNGNVGIGTDNPGARLHAYTTGYPVAKFERYGSSAATRGSTQLGHSSLGYSGGTGADTYIVAEHGFGVAVNAGTHALVITDGGNVGIGIAPRAKLDILQTSNRTSKTGTTRGVLHLQDGDTPASNEITAITFESNSNNASTIIGQTLTNNGSELFFGTSNGYASGVTNTAMTINPSGNVGIGTSSPSTKLTVRNDNSSTAFGDNNILTLQNLNITDNNRYGIGFTGNTNIGSGLALIEAQSYDQSQGHTSLNFSVYNGSWHEDMMVLKAGNVGIGTSNPLAPLHVNGNIVVGSGDNNQKIYMEGAVNDLNMIHRSTTENAMIMTSRHAMALIIDSNNDDGDTGTGSFSVRRNGTTITGSASCLEVIPNGNVGIGTSSPTTELDVAGTVTADQYNTDATLPTTKPSLLLDFANSKSLDPGITFTRSSTGTYYDGKTTAKAEENLVTYSNNLSAWSIARATRTTGETAPDGTTTAIRLTQVNTTTYGPIYKGLGTFPIDDGVYTLSIYAKYGTSTYLQLASSEGGVGASFNLSNGTVANTTNASATMSSLGNGWYRLSMTQSNPGQAGFYVGNANSNTVGAPPATDGQYSILWGAQIEVRGSASNYTPTTTSAITTYQPKMLTAAVNKPRFDHDPVTGESKGLLIEQSHTNVVYESNNSFIATTGNTVNFTNQGIAPDGTNTADAIMATAGTGGSGYAYRGASNWIGNTGSWTLSFYYKRVWGTANIFAGRGGSPGNIYASINGSNVVSGSVNGSMTLVSAHREDIGNGWYRAVVTATSSSSTPGYGESQAFPAGSNSKYLIWGLQLENQGFASSYIPTTNGSTTRGADRAQMIGPSFTSWFTPNNGAFYTEYQSAAGNNNHFVYQVSNGNNVAGIIDQVRSRFRISPDNQNYADINSGTIVSGTFHKIASSFAENDFAISLDGASVVTDTSGRIDGGADRITIGDRSATNALLNGHIKKLAFYPQRLSNATLQEMTKE